MIDERRMETVVACSVYLQGYLLGGAEENREQYLRIAAGRDLNQAPREYMSRALLIHQHTR